MSGGRIKKSLFEGVITMGDTSTALMEVIKNTPVIDREKLKKQQAYYKRLMQNGTAQKQTYNLKSVSSI